MITAEVVCDYQFRRRLIATMFIDYAGSWLMEILTKRIFASKPPAELVTRGSERREKRRAAEELALKSGPVANGHVPALLEKKKAIETFLHCIMADLSKRSPRKLSAARGEATTRFLPCRLLLHAMVGYPCPVLARPKRTAPLGRLLSADRLTRWMKIWRKAGTGDARESSTEIQTR